MLSIGLSIVISTHSAGAFEWSPLFLFDSETNGFWAGGLKPPAWVPLNLFESGEDGILFDDGFSPEDDQ